MWRLDNPNQLLFVWMVGVCVSVLFHPIANAEASIYKWTDENGYVHFGDKSPKEPYKIINTPPEKINVTKSPDCIDINKDTYCDLKDISSSVTETDVKNTPFPVTIFKFTKVNLKDPFIHKLEIHNNDVWIGTEIGLVKHQPQNGKWLLIDKSTGLPVQGVMDLVWTASDLWINGYTDKSPTSWGPFENYIYSEFEHTFLETKEYSFWLNIGGEFNTKNSDALRDYPSDSGYLNNKVWLAYKGADDGSHTWVGGGVSALDSITKRGISFTDENGLSDPYCEELVIAEERYVWVSHHDVKSGVDYYDTKKGKWHNVKISKNEIPVWGSYIESVNKYLLISGRGRDDIILYDRNTDMALRLGEYLGLPNPEASDIKVGPNYIWMAINSWNHETRKTQKAIVRIPKNDLLAYFEQSIEDKNVKKNRLKQRNKRKPLVYFTFNKSLKDIGPYSITLNTKGDEIKFKRGIKGQAAFLNGQGYLEASWNNIIDSSSNIKIDFWFKGSASNKAVDKSQLLLLLTTGDSSQIFTLFTTPPRQSPPLKSPSAAQLTLRHPYQVDYSYRYNSIMSDAGSTQINSWHHVIIKYSRSNNIFSLSLDGTVIGQKKLRKKLEFSNEFKLRIGAWYANQQAFRGYIDELKIFYK